MLIYMGQVSHIEVTIPLVLDQEMTNVSELTSIKFPKIRLNSTLRLIFTQVESLFRELEMRMCDSVYRMITLSGMVM